MSGSITIRYCTVDELESAPNLKALFDAYEEESSIAGMPSNSPQVHTYRMLEKSGVLQCIGAFKGEELIGFVCVLTTILPHYGARMSSTESIFVAKEHRASRAGMYLIREAERLAERLQSVGLAVCAPIGGRLDQLLPLIGYEPTNRVYVRRFAHD